MLRDTLNFSVAEGLKTLGIAEKWDITTLTVYSQLMSNEVKSFVEGGEEGTAGAARHKELNDELNLIDEKTKWY